MRIVISNELKLAVECCRYAFSGEQRRELGDTASHVEWDRFVRVLRRQRVQGFASDALRHNEVSVPASISEVLAAEARAIAAQNLRAAAECKVLLDRFCGAQVPLLFFKGLTTAALAYRIPLLKMSWDIDILIAPQDLSKAAALLNGAGFRPLIPDSPSALSLFRWHENRKESLWYAPDSELFLELHTRVTGNPALLPELTVSSASQSVEITPGLSLPTFALPELLLYVSVHGSSSAWSRLKWVADFAALLARRDSLTPEELYERSLRLRVGPAAAQALIVADSLFGIAMTEALRNKLSGDRLAPRLAAAAIRHLSDLREPTARPFGTATNHVLQFFLMPGLRFKWRELLRQLSDIRLNRSIGDTGAARARAKAESKAVPAAD